MKVWNVARSFCSLTKRMVTLSLRDWLTGRERGSEASRRHLGNEQMAKEKRKVLGSCMKFTTQERTRVVCLMM